MTLRYRVIQNHRANEINFLVLKKGDRVVKGEEYIGNPVWKNWVYCISEGTLKEGWIPRQLLQDMGEEYYLLEDYTSKELSCTTEDILIPLRELNNWAFCVNPTSLEKGWVPLSQLEPVEMEEEETAL